MLTLIVPQHGSQYPLRNIISSKTGQILLLTIYLFGPSLGCGKNETKLNSLRVEEEEIRFEPSVPEDLNDTIVLEQHPHSPQLPLTKNRADLTEYGKLLEVDEQRISVWKVSQFHRYLLERIEVTEDQVPKPIYVTYMSLTGGNRPEKWKVHGSYGQPLEWHLGHEEGLFLISLTITEKPTAFSILKAHLGKSILYINILDIQGLSDDEVHKYSVSDKLEPLGGATVEEWLANTSANKELLK